MANAENNTPECPTCGRDDFKNEHGLKVHRGHAHDYQAQFECEWCGVTVELSHHEAKGRRFCSIECAGKWNGAQQIGEDNHNWAGGLVELECETCGELFEVKKNRSHARFCSKECEGVWISDRQRGEDNPVWNGGPSEYGPGWNWLKKEAVRERDGRCCQNCDLSEARHIEIYGCKHNVHHIEPADTFDDPEKRNAMGNLITLCQGACHKKWESMAPLKPLT